MSAIKFTRLECDGDDCLVRSDVTARYADQVRAKAQREEGWVRRDGKDFCAWCARSLTLLDADQ